MDDSVPSPEVGQLPSPAIVIHSGIRSEMPKKVQLLLGARHLELGGDRTQWCTVRRRCCSRRLGYMAIGMNVSRCRR